MLLGELTLDAAPASSAIDKLEGKMGGLTSAGGALGGLLGDIASGPLGAITAAVGTAAGIIGGLANVMNLGGQLHDVSLATGETAGSLVILREAFSEAGLGADSVGGYLLKMQKALNGMNEDGEDASKVFKTLGVSVTELKSLDAIGQFQALQKGFAGITDQAQRVQIARDLLGKGGGKALALLGDPEVLDDARKRAGPLADIMDKNADSFDKLGDVVESLKLNFQEFFGGLLSKLAPELTKIADALGNIDFTGFGETVGALVTPFVRLLTVLGELAPLINEVGEFASYVAGSGSTANIGLSGKYGGHSKLLGAQSDSSFSGPITGLSKFGGGFFGNGGAQTDPLLIQAQQTNQLLRTIAENTRRSPTGSSLPGLPV